MEIIDYLVLISICELFIDKKSGKQHFLWKNKKFSTMKREKKVKYSIID